MSTCAKWKLWVGAKLGFIDLTEAPSSTIRILDQLDERPYSTEGLELSLIYMHGMPVGVGVEVMEVDWTNEIGPENVVDISKVTKAVALVPKVKNVFRNLGLNAQILVMNHIDLGG